MNLKRPPITVYTRGDESEQVRSELITCLRYIDEELGHSWVKPDVLDRVIEKDRQSGEEPAIIYPDTDRDDIVESALIVQTDVGDNDRRGLRDLIQRISQDDSPHKRLVTSSADRLIDDPVHDLGSLNAIVQHYDLEIHLIHDGITLHAGSELSRPLLRVLAASTTGDNDEDGDLPDAAISPHHGGRPPLGLTSIEGTLQPGDDPSYELVCETLQAVADGLTSKRQAAHKLSCTRATIDAALQRPELYGLE